MANPVDPGPNGKTDADEVVVLVDGGARTAARRPRPRRPSGAVPEVGAPRAGPSTESPQEPPSGWNAARSATADRPSKPGGAPAPEPAPGAGRPPRPPRNKPEGSFLRRNLRVPGTFGLVIIVLCLAVGTGFAGAFIWASNDANNIRTAPVPPSIARRSDVATQPEITTTTKPDLSADTLKEKLSASVWTVRTFNSVGQPVEGSATLTRSADGQSLLLTSFAVVEASSHLPAPEITVSGGGFNGKAQLWTWDAARDLALLVAGGTETPAIDWVPDLATLKLGDKIFALGGDSKLKPGIVTGVSNQAVDHNVFIDDAFRGGPIVNVKGEVVAVSSAVYTAGGAPTETAFFGVPIRASCGGVLVCSGAFAGSVGEAPATPTEPEAEADPDATTTTVLTSTDDDEPD